MVPGLSLMLLRLASPQLILDVPGDLYCMKINPNNANLVIGGLMTGQVRGCVAGTTLWF